MGWLRGGLLIRGSAVTTVCIAAAAAGLFLIERPIARHRKRLRVERRDPRAALDLLSRSAAVIGWQEFGAKDDVRGSRSR